MFIIIYKSKICLKNIILSIYMQAFHWKLSIKWKTWGNGINFIKFIWKWWDDWDKLCTMLCLQSKSHLHLEVLKQLKRNNTYVKRAKFWMHFDVDWLKQCTRYIKPFFPVMTDKILHFVYQMKWLATGPSSS